MERVAITDKGRVLSDNKKRHKKREKHDFVPSEQPKTNSHTNFDVATTKGMKPVMKAGGRSTGGGGSNCEYKNSGRSPDPNYEPGCHPHWR